MTADAWDETVEVEIPIMGMVYRDATPEEVDELERQQVELSVDASTPAEYREIAYNTLPCVEWGGDMMTVTQAANQWAYYAAEGRTDKTDALTSLIAEAKQFIREQYPDDKRKLGIMELTAIIPLAKIQKIELYQNLSRLPMATIKARTGADYIINGGIYSFQTFKPFGNVKIDGKIIYSPGYGEYGFAWNEGPDISYERLPSNKRSYLGCVGMVLGGVKQVMHFASSFGGNRQRSAIGLKDGNLVLYACNGIHSKSPESMQTYAMKKGWSYGLLLDGGGSTQCCFPNGTIKSPENNGKGRIVQNYILVYLKKEAAGDSGATTATACPYREPTVTVKNGTRGESAKWVQWHLQKIGYDIGKIDGIFGTKSVAALLDFQSKHGLTADGACGKITRAALKTV